MSVKKERIPTLVEDGMDGLQQLLTILNDGAASPGAAVVESSLARFKLWAGSLGAHRASGSRSLQYRLRDASSIRTLLISLLEDLTRLVLREALPLVRNGRIQEAEREDGEYSETEELIAYFDDDDSGDNESQEALDDHDKELSHVLTQIGGVIDCLLRLSVTISNPAPHDRFKSRAGGQVGYYEPWDIQHVLEKFPNIDRKLAERLGRALTQRRKYFKYREDHHCRLRQGLDGDDDGASKWGATTLASSVPLHLKDKGDTSLKLDLGVLDDDRSEPSATSYATSTVDQSQLRVPPIPREHTEGPFLCPFCYVFITVDDRREWKKHVFRDLRPYVCLSAACVAADQDFQRRKDWTRHMSQEHWRQWVCPLGCAVNPSSPSSLRRHIEDVHSRVVSAKSIDSITSQSSKPDLQQSLGPCPLCKDVEIKSNHQYQSHVGHHLEQLALFVLPSHNYESEGEDKEEGDESDRNDEEEDELSSRDDYPLPDGRTAYWSVAEMNEFPDLLKRYGPDWLAISRHMKTKTRIMVKSFFNRMVVENPQWQQIADEASVEPRLDGSNHIVENTKISDDVPNASEQAGGSSHVSPTDIQRGPQSEIDIDEAHRQESLFKYGDVPSGQDTSGFDQQSPSPGTIKWHGGEPVRTSNDGSGISFRTNEEIDLIENVGEDVRMNRSHSEEMADEHEIMRSMARRLKNASPEEMRLYKCREPGCNREFRRPVDLIKHEKTHSRPWKCPIESCKYHEYGWPTEKEMDRHYSGTHNIPPPRRLECLFPPCPYTCKRKDNLRSHMKRAHGWQDAETETNESDFGDQTSRVRIAEALGRIGDYFANPVLDPFEQIPGDERSDIYKSTTAKDYEQSGEISEGPVSEYFNHWDNIRRHDSNNEALSNAGKAEPQAPFTAEGSVHGLDVDWLKDQDIGSLPRPPETEMQTKAKDTEEPRRSFTEETVEKRNVATENDANENQEREKQTPEKESGRRELEFRTSATVEERESQRVAWEEDMSLQAEQELRDRFIAEKAVIGERSIQEAIRIYQEQQEAEDIGLMQTARLATADMKRSIHDISPPLAPVSANDTTLETNQTTYTRMARRHLSIEALRVRSIDFELDANPDYVLIHRWVPPEEQKELWSMTKVIRDGRDGVSHGVDQKSRRQSP